MSNEGKPNLCYTVVFGVPIYKPSKQAIRYLIPFITKSPAVFSKLGYIKLPVGYQPQREALFTETV